MTKKPVNNAGKVYKKYTEEFRRDAVRMIETEGLTTAEVVSLPYSGSNHFDWLLTGEASG